MTFKEFLYNEKLKRFPIVEMIKKKTEAIPFVLDWNIMNATQKEEGDYRLGNWLMCFNPEMVARWIKLKTDYSKNGVEYLEKSIEMGCCQHHRLFFDIMNREHPDIEGGSRDELVVHLRITDRPEVSNRVDELIEKIERILSDLGISKVKFVTGFHYPGLQYRMGKKDKTKLREYLRAMDRDFSVIMKLHQKFDCEFVVGNHPEEDLVYLAKSKNLLVTIGTFSRTVSVFSDFYGETENLFYFPKKKYKHRKCVKLTDKWFEVFHKKMKEPGLPENVGKRRIEEFLDMKDTFECG